MGKRGSWGFGLVLGLMAVTVQAASPSLQSLLKPYEHALVSLSPAGTYIAVTKRLEDSVVLVIIDRKTHEIVRTLDPRKNGEVARLVWANDQRLFVMNARTDAATNEAYLEPELVAINADGSRRRTFYADVVDTLLDDDERILIRRCARKSSKGCWNYVQRSDNDGSHDGERIADAPMPDASFMADNQGQVRFAYSWDNADSQQLWLLHQGEWTQLNDEAASGVEVLPIGVSRDGGSGYLRSERLAGPDVIERIVFASGERDVVMSDPEFDPLHVLWSADGTQPIGAAYGLGVPRARFWNPSDPDAQVIRQLEAAFPKDAVAFTSGTRDGNHAIVSVWSDKDPGSYYLFDRTAKRTSLLLRAKPWLSPPDLAASQPVSFMARDGTELQGYLTMPQGSVESPPLVVLPHGGPFGIRDAWTYDEEVQILAAHGYATLRVNFRGSDGHGRAFEESGFRQWGRKMQDDVTDATRWAITQGRADPERICIWGTSYGGYAALMGAVQAPDLYRCVVATSAVTDLNLSWKWGDTQRSIWGQNFLERAMGDDPKALRAASPVEHAGRIRADVLLVHGRRDGRVSYEHAKAMLAAFEDAGKPVEQQIFGDETHGIHGDENREEYYEQVLAFLARSIGADREPRPPAGLAPVASGTPEPVDASTDLAPAN